MGSRKKCMNDELLGHEEDIISVAISYDNKFIVSGSCDIAVRIWDMDNKIQKFMFNLHSPVLNTIFIDRYTVSRELNGNLIVWDFRSRTKIAELKDYFILTHL